MAFRDEIDHVSSADEVAADWDREYEPDDRFGFLASEDDDARRLGSHGSHELDADAAKLLEVGVDPGVTLEDLGFTQDDGGAGDDDDLVY